MEMSQSESAAFAENLKLPEEQELCWSKAGSRVSVMCFRVRVYVLFGSEECLEKIVPPNVCRWYGGTFSFHFLIGYIRFFCVVPSFFRVRYCL